PLLCPPPPQSLAHSFLSTLSTSASYLFYFPHLGMDDDDPKYVLIFASLFGVSLLSVVTGLVFDVSQWIGGTLFVILLVAVCFHMKERSKAPGSAAEAVLLNVVIPVLTAYSVLSQLVIPVATTAFRVVLIAYILPALQLMYLTRKHLHHPLILFCSSQATHLSIHMPFLFLFILEFWPVNNCSVSVYFENTFCCCIYFIVRLIGLISYFSQPCQCDRS
ncbi:hypothetical protein PMAYCL1PPCAC_20273, partial [Pristionchus mayeri]